MDQRGGDGRFNGGIDVFAISSGQEFQDFRTAGRNDRFCVEPYHQNSYFKKKVSLEEQQAQKEDRFLR